jgi:hypothetical protein
MKMPIFALATVLAAGLAGCGGNDHDHHNDHDHTRQDHRQPTTDPHHSGAAEKPDSQTAEIKDRFLVNLIFHF